MFDPNELDLGITLEQFFTLSREEQLVHIRIVLDRMVEQGKLVKITLPNGKPAYQKVTRVD